MKLTKVADKLLNRLLPKVEAAAGKCGCQIRYNTCEGGFWTVHLYMKLTDYYGQCTVWGALCYKDRTEEWC